MIKIYEDMTSKFTGYRAAGETMKTIPRFLNEIEYRGWYTWVLVVCPTFYKSVGRRRLM